MLDETDPVPSDVITFAKAAFSWRTIDAELAAQLDSAPVGVYSSALREMSIEAGPWMLYVAYDESTGRLLGQIAPQSTYSVELHTCGALLSVDSDVWGRFEADGVQAGPVSMVLHFTEGTVVTTKWVVL